MSTSNDEAPSDAASNQPRAGAVGSSGAPPPTPQAPPPGAAQAPAGGGGQQAPGVAAGAPSSPPINSTNNRDSPIGTQVIASDSTVTVHQSGLSVEMLRELLSEFRPSNDDRRPIKTFSKRMKGGVLKEVYDQGQYERQTSGRPAAAVTADRILPKSVEEYAQQFEQLGYEEKLFVTLLRLFPNIGWVDYWEIYNQAHKVLIPQLMAQQGKSKAGKKGSELKTPPHLRPESYWEQVAYAVVSQIPQIYPEGKASNTTVDFLPQVRPFVEQALATQHRSWLFQMVPIIFALGSHPYGLIRRMAGEAAAILASIDWDYVRREIIEQWSQDERTATRAAVGYALDAILQAGINDGYAVYLLNRWSNPVGSFYWRQCWTATAAYKLIGKHRFAFAAENLRQIAQLADTMLGLYITPHAPTPQDHLDQIKPVDLELMDQLPRAVNYALVYLAFEGKMLEVVHTLKSWAAAPREPKIWYVFWEQIIYNTLYDIGEGAFTLRRDKTEVKQDFFVLLQENQEFRRCLADVLSSLYKQSAPNRRAVLEILQNWVEHLDDLKLSTEPVVKIVKRMFRYVDHDVKQGQNRDRLLRAMQRWTTHSHTAVKAVGTTVVQSILGTPPRLVAPREPPDDPSSNGRIVFGKP